MIAVVEHDWIVTYRHHGRSYGYAECRQCGEKRAGGVWVITKDGQEYARVRGPGWDGECKRKDAE